MKKTGKKAPEAVVKSLGGRPKSENPRKRPLPVRVTEDEIAAIRQRAEAAGMRLSDYCRRRLGLAQTGYGQAE